MLNQKSLPVGIPIPAKNNMLLARQSCSPPQVITIVWNRDRLESLITIPGIRRWFMSASERANPDLYELFRYWLVQWVMFAQQAASHRGA